MQALVLALKSKNRCAGAICGSFAQTRSKVSNLLHSSFQPAQVALTGGSINWNKAKRPCKIFMRHVEEEEAEAEQGEIKQEMP